MKNILLLFSLRLSFLDKAGCVRKRNKITNRTGRNVISPGAFFLFLIFFFILSSTALAAHSSVSPKTNAIASPINRTLSSAKTGWSLIYRPIEFSPGISLAVRIITTPSTSCADEISKLIMCAWGN